MNNYYVKLITIEGQYDAAYINSKDINVDVFQCDKICDNFNGIIPANSNILFEFKNGKSGVRKVMTQAKRYQITAKRIFGKDKFYHIIIVRDKLFNVLREMENRIKNYNFNNFVILNIGGNPLKLFGQELTQYKDDDNKAKNPMSSKNSVKSYKTTGSKCGNTITRD